MINKPTAFGEKWREQIGVIGCGNLGGALVRGLIDSRTVEAAQVFVYDKSAEKMAELATLGVTSCRDESEVVKQSSVLVVAVKPHHMHEVLTLIGTQLTEKLHTLISVAAGISLPQINSALGRAELTANKARLAIVRVMPNLPAVVRAGTCGIFGESREGVKLAEGLFSSLGKTVVMDSEEQLDVVTALSAGGPAFTSVFIAGLIEGGCAMGLTMVQSRELALHMLRGTAELLLTQGLDPDKLVEQVATPNGTTMAGLGEFKAGDLRGIAASAIRASTLRAREIRDGR